MQNDQRDETNPMVTSRAPTAKRWMGHGWHIVVNILFASLHPCSIPSLQKCMDDGPENMDAHPSIHLAFQAGLAVNTVHMFMNICSRSLFANTVQNRTRCEHAEGTLLHKPKRGRRRRRRPLFGSVKTCSLGVFTPCSILNSICEQ